MTLPVIQDVFIHESCYVEEPITLGRGTKIWHFCHLSSGVVIGERCTLGQNVYVGPNVVIGNNVKIQNNVSVYEGVILEDDVFCGPSCVFTNVFNPRSHRPRKDEFRKTVVMRGTTVGANATILCGITVGRYVLIGAGSVVTRDVPDFALGYGSPFRVKGWVCRCGSKLLDMSLKKKKRAACLDCGDRYIWKEGQLVEEAL